MSGTNNNKQTENLKASKLAKVLLGFTVISFLCFVSFLFTATNIAGILFLVSPTFSLRSCKKTTNSKQVVSPI